MMVNELCMDKGGVFERSVIRIYILKAHIGITKLL